MAKNKSSSVNQQTMKSIKDWKKVYTPKSFIQEQYEQLAENMNNDSDALVNFLTTELAKEVKEKLSSKK
ncbi:MAG: hypothetical protein ACRC2S_12295 [Waterburya sp.]